MTRVLKYLFLLLPFAVKAQQKEVLYKRYSKDSTVVQEWYLKNNKPYKHWKTFYKDKKHHYQRNFNANGDMVEEGWMLNSIKNGFWIEYLSSTKTAKGFYASGVKNETWRFYTGEHLDSIGDFKNGIEVNEWLYYENNALVCKKTYQKQTGDYYMFTYHANGKIKEQGAFKNRLKDGYWEFYDEKKVLLTTGFYKKGLKDGYWHFFSENGKLLSEGVFFQNKKDKWWQFFNKEGGLLKKCELKEDELDGFCIHYKNDKIVKGNFFKKGVKKNEWVDWKSFKKDYKTIK